MTLALYVMSKEAFLLHEFMPTTLGLAVFVAYVVSGNRWIRYLYYAALCVVILLNLCAAVWGDWLDFVVPAPPEDSVLDPSNYQNIAFRATVCRDVVMILILTGPL